MYNVVGKAPSCAQPVPDDNTTWEQLPQIELKDLGRKVCPNSRTWAIKQEIDIHGFAGVERGDVGHRARNSLAQITATLHGPSAAPAVEDQAMRYLQESLRESHQMNFARLSETSRRVSKTSSSRHASINSHVVGLKSSVVDSRSLGMSKMLVETSDSNSVNERRRLLFASGFIKPMAENCGFTGTCSLCLESNTVLALLLREPPSSVATPRFPLPQSSLKATIYWNRITAALPLVPHSENKKAQEIRPKVAFQDRLADHDNALVFIAVLYVQILKPRAKLSENDELFLRALKWACTDLRRSVYSPISLSDSSAGPSIRLPPDESLYQNAHAATKAEWVYIFQYPIEGFIIITMILDSQKDYHQHLAAYGRMPTHLMMTQAAAQDPQKRGASPPRRDLGRLQQPPRISSSFLFRPLASLTRILFGDHPKALQPKLAVGVELLAKAPLISTDTLLLMRKLGANFEWIDNQANSALAVFLHYLFRYRIEYSSPADHSKMLVALTNVSKVFRDPADVSPRTAENLVKLLPR
ncbi:hypothetical protein DL769_003711 [Monosporascus sp. CRB-8-3]|nr:hypothetical protein DL769_003711 [Monosporascus sp. CRB-8-3]